MNKTTKKILAIVMLIAVLFSFMPFNALVSYAVDAVNENECEHEYGDYVETLAPTCQREGVMTRTCKKCSKTETINTPKVEHNFGRYTTTKKATCKEDAVQTSVCTYKCGTKDEKVIIDSHKTVKHTWDATTGKCKVCEIACTHEWDASNGTCKICKFVCQHTEAKDYVEIDGSAVEPTCITAGKQADKKCPVCGQKQTTGETITATGIHTYSETPVIDVPATCETPGTMSYKCTTEGCSDKKTVTIAATGHDWNAETGKCNTCDKACTHDWNAETGKCKICGYECKHEHTEDVANSAVAATCGTAGKQADKKCLDCQYIIKGTEVPATGEHEWNETKTVDKKATCASGSKSTHCKNCSAIKEGSEEEIPATGKHSFSRNYTQDEAPTCGKAGSESKKCTICGEKGTPRAIPATGNHDWSLKTGKCANCEETCDHSEGAHLGEVTPATCTTLGKEADTICNKCGKVLLEGKEIPMTEHDLGGYTLDKEATCMESGIMTKHCKNCNYRDEATKIETTKKPHEFGATTTIKEATCTENQVVGEKCKNCETVNNEREVENSATGHDLVETVTAPTCTEKGYTTVTCKNCDYKETKNEVKATGHKYSKKVTAATCTKDGYTTYTCANCGDSYKADVVKATGHKYSKKVTAATCTKDGYTTYTCANCANSYKANIVKATGHKYSKKVTAATCTKDGYTTYTCANCGDSYKADEVKATGHSYTKKTTKATAKKDGKVVTSCTKCNKIAKTEKIAKVKSVSLSKTSYIYNGKAKKPSVTVKDSNGKVINSKYYTVTYKNNKNIGKATVTITLKGNYSGTITKTFTISPEKVKGTKVKKTTKSTATLSWNKVPGNVTGYKVYVWNNDTQKYDYYGKVKGTTSMTVKSLKGNTKYKFKVKAYKTVKGTQYCASRSDAFKGRTK